MSHGDGRINSVPTLYWQPSGSATGYGRRPDIEKTILDCSSGFGLINGNEEKRVDSVLKKLLRG